MPHYLQKMWPIDKKLNKYVGLNEASTEMCTYVCTCVDVYT